MPFISIEFFIFIGVAAGLYFILPTRWRWAWLLAASYFYYWRWSPQFLPVVIIPTLVSYAAGVWMTRMTDGFKRKLLLFLSLGTTLGILILFKYFPFTLNIVDELTMGMEDLAMFIGPVGIAFYSLQVVSYTVDVYRGTQEPEKHVGKYALFVVFFPQLVSGPITRAKTLLHQIERSPGFDPDNMAAGLQRVLWGAFQKYAIADRLAVVVNQVYEDPGGHSGWAVIIAAYLFAIQIYCDFAGYSNIAIGIAKTLGFDLAENFNLPYFSTDVADFWNRWHISLSTWLRDYIFYPTMRFIRKYGKVLGGLFVAIIPPLLTMFVSGAWHGVGWNFILWGLIHGLLLILAAQTANWRRKLVENKGKAFGFIFKILQIFVTFNLVTLAWVFFRADSISQAFSILLNMLVFPSNFGDLDTIQLIGVGILTGIYFMLEVLRVLKIDSAWLSQRPLVFRWGVYTAGIILLLFLGNFEGAQQFIYAQF
jgi:D-alanyl-lipoteichoic acid acyltransferase DltB (MBOAT superfamily)